MGTGPGGAARSGPLSSESAPTGRRAYRSPRRAQQAADTRAAVVAAATLLFAARGWAATGMRDVAREAGVSVETLYTTFGTKRDLLLAAIDVGVVGDTEPVPLDQRAEFAALAQGSRRQRTRAGAKLVTDIHRRNAGLILALREAAASDQEAAGRLRDVEQGRRRDVEAAVAMVTGRAATGRECDGVWAVTDVEVYRLLTDWRGWTVEEFETWLAEVIEWLLRDGRSVP